MDKSRHQNRLPYVTPGPPALPQHRIPPHASSRRGRHCMVFFGVVSACFLAACATDPALEEKKTTPKNQPAIVGRVASISSDRAFVLIQAYGEWTVASGAVLTTRGAEDRAANLLVTGEKLGQFAAADIQSGDVLVGDIVMQLPTATPETAPPTLQPAPVSPPEAPSGP